MPKRSTYHSVHRQVLRAFARGDHATAFRWILVMERFLATARTANDLDDNRCAPRPKFRKPPEKPTAPKGPVMLDPKGYSPGGHPNWYLNQLRLERAGLKKPV